MKANHFHILFIVLLGCTSAQDEPETRAPRSPAGESGAPGLPSPDSLRGTLELTGTDSAAQVAMRTTNDVVALSGAALGALRRIPGLEVVVRGTRTPRGFDVASFAVRAANGEEAVDGVLDLENGVFFLRTDDGMRVPVPTLPVPLRGEIGSRVYLVGSLTNGVSAFGVLAEGR
jgi:hypothetical protein